MTNGLKNYNMFTGDRPYRDRDGKYSNRGFVKLTMKTKGKIKVLECIRQGKIGGGESHLLNLVENLDRERFDPIVLSFTDGPMIDRLKQMGVETHIIFTEKP